MSGSRLLRRWTHRRALAAAGAAALVVCAILYATHGDPDAPYKPGESVEGITDVNRASRSAGGDWSIRFKDIAAASGIDFRHFSGGARSTQLPEDMGSGCAFADYDRDGDWDLFVADTAGPLTLSPDEMRKTPGGCRLYRNDGGVFTDVTQEAGLGDLKGIFMGAAWGDYDNDGYPDLVVTSYGEIRLFHNRGDGTFEDVSKKSGVAGRRGFWTGAVWGDADGDGLLDLYVCNYVDYRFDPKDAGKISGSGAAASPFTINPESYPPAPNLLFHNEGHGRFREMAAEAGVADPTGRSLSATFADFNDDGRPDLYVANDVSEGALFVNEGEGIFSDRGHEAHVADYRGSMGIAVGDADGDGALDMFVTHWIAEANAFYLNKRLKRPGAGALDFEDAAERFGLGQISTDDIAWGTAFLDVDGDGWPDLVVANGSTFEDPADTRKLLAMPMRLFWNREGKRFVDVAPFSGSELIRPRVGRGLAIADVDGDLREEIAVVVHGGSLALLKAEGGPANHRVAFRCEGTRSNRSAFGTKLVVAAGGRTQIREIGAGSSYLSQNAPEAIFGLGAQDRVERLTVRWPSGSTQVFTDLPADRAYGLVEGDAEAHPLEDRRARTLAFWDAHARAREAAAGSRTADAIAGYRKALSIDPRHEDSLYVLGNLCLEAGDRPAAKSAFESLIAVQPRSARGHGALGDLLADPASGALQNLDAARRHYEQAGGLNAEETGWVVRLGEVALREGDERAAARQFQKVLVTHPHSFQALYFLGYLAWRGGDGQEARRRFDASFAALGPQAAPAPGEGDVRKAEKPLPRRGAFAGHWAYLARGGVRLEDAYRELDGELRACPRDDRDHRAGRGVVRPFALRRLERPPEKESLMISVTIAERPLNLRSLSSVERSSKALASFDALAPGEKLVLLSGDAGSDLLRRLQAQRRGLFEWSVLEPGPAIWRIEVARRAGPGGALRGVNEALSWDHDRLEALEAAAFEKRALGDLQLAYDLYAEFAAGLKRHIGFEEQLLFPAFEEKTGMPPTAGPTAVMRAEHREIEALLGEIEARIADAAAPVESLRRSFHAVLEDHSVKEEQILYPTTDHLLGEEEADRLVERIQRFGG